MKDEVFNSLLSIFIMICCIVFINASFYSDLVLHSPLLHWIFLVLGFGILGVFWNRRVL